MDNKDDVSREIKSYIKFINLMGSSSDISLNDIL